MGKRRSTLAGHAGLMRINLLIISSALMLLVWGAQNGALAQIEQITNTTEGDNTYPSINANGTRIAFQSDRDITGGNGDHNTEIFLFDAATGFTQVTDTTGGVNIFPAINANGTQVVFQSNRNLTGGNGDLNFEIFLYDSITPLITQITNTSGGANVNPTINADGTRIAFESDGDFTGGNGDHNTEIFLFDTGTGFGQITDTTWGASVNSSINADGTRIAFMSIADITGGNPDHNSEIFLFDTGTGVTQVTDTTVGSNLNSSINASGTRIAFTSNRDLTGGNGDHNFEIFLFDTAMGLTQVTDTIAGGNVYPSINADGTRIAFYSSSDHTGENGDGNLEIFLFDAATGVTQVTHSTGGDSQNPSISADGTRIAFFSTSDLTGENPDGNLEIFVVTLEAPVSASVPAANEWGVMIFVLMAGTVSLYYMKKKKMSG